MPSNRTPTTFYGPAVAAGATVYTVPANKIAVIRYFAAVPTGAGAGYAQAGVDGGASADSVFYKDVDIAESLDAKTEWAYIPLTEGQTIYGECSDASLLVAGDLYDE